MTSKLLCSITALLALASSPACSNCGPATAARGSVSATCSITVLSQPTTLRPCWRGLRDRALAPPRERRRHHVCVRMHGHTKARRRPSRREEYDATLSLQAADGTILATAPTQAGITIGAAQGGGAEAGSRSPVSNRGKARALARNADDANQLPAAQPRWCRDHGIRDHPRAFGRGLRAGLPSSDRAETRPSGPTQSCAAPHRWSAASSATRPSQSMASSRGSYAIHVGGLIRAEAGAGWAMTSYWFRRCVARQDRPPRVATSHGLLR